MSRLFWMGVGAAVGVMMTRRVNRAARHLTPTGFADDVGDALRELALAVGSFGADVRAGMVERERELHRMVDQRTGIPTGRDAHTGNGDGHRGEVIDADYPGAGARSAGRGNMRERARRAAN